MNRIRELREVNGWTQAQLGKRIGVAKTTITGYEREDRQPTPATICALCDLFGCTADYLLGRSSTQLPVMSDEDARILEAYHAAPDRIRDAIDLLLFPPEAETAREKKDA